MNVGENSKILYGPSACHRLPKKPTVAEFTRVVGVAPVALYGAQERSSPLVNAGSAGSGVNIAESGTRRFGQRLTNYPWHGVKGDADGNDGFYSGASAALAPSTWSFVLAVMFNPNAVPTAQDNQCTFGLIDSGGTYFMVRITALRVLQFLCRDGTNTKIVAPGTIGVNDRRPVSVIAGYDAGAGLFYAESNSFPLTTLAAGAWTGYAGANLTARMTNYAASSNSENYTVAYGAWTFGALSNVYTDTGGRLRKFGWK